MSTALIHRSINDCQPTRHPIFLKGRQKSDMIGKSLIRRLNCAVGAGWYADAVAVAFCRIYDCLAVYQGYGFLGAGFDTFKRTTTFVRVNNYFHSIPLF